MSLTNSSPSGLTLKGARKLIELAYYDVEELREAKAKAEKVPYVPGPKPVDIYDAFEVVEILKRLRGEKHHLKTWFEVASENFSIGQADEILKMLEPFGVQFIIHTNNYNGNKPRVEIVKQAKTIQHVERETYGD